MQQPKSLPVFDDHSQVRTDGEAGFGSSPTSFIAPEENETPWRPLRPFVSWAGSKRKLIPQIETHLPTRFDRYIEPFLGAGSIFLHLCPPCAILNDACRPLIETWQAIRDDPEGVHREATKRPLNKESYYSARNEQGGARSSVLDDSFI